MPYSEPFKTLTGIGLQSSESVVMLAGPNAELKFESDGSQSNRGFQAKVTAMPGLTTSKIERQSFAQISTK